MCQERTRAAQQNDIRALAIWRGLLFVVLGLNLLLLLEYWLGWLPLRQPQPHLRHVG
jgi:hypothetical protein